MSDHKTLLVVDWDFFFPVVEHPAQDRFPGEWMLYDWGHSESIMFIEATWHVRALSFLQSGASLPTTNGQEHLFWDRFDIDDSSELYVSESNALAADVNVSEGVGEVLLFDAHHDAGYNGGNDDSDALDVVRNGRYTCENWMFLYWALGADLNVYYPTWRSRAFEIEPTPWVPVNREHDDGLSRVKQKIDRVFICRSGAWVPPWLDKSFLDFVSACPLDVTEELGDYPLAPREFDQAQIQAFLESRKQLAEQE